MNKSTHFSGQPTFVQIIRLMPRDIIAQVIARNGSDYGTKRFNTWSHLLTMIFSCCANCESIRELVTGIRAMESDSTPNIIHLSPAANNDNIFIKHLDVPQGSTVLMDMGYRNFKQFNQWTNDNVTWVTRLHPYTSYGVKKRYKVSRKEKQSGVKSDVIIRMGAQESKAEKVNCRRVHFKSPHTGKAFYFITNDLVSSPSTIADAYKKRWGIELLFKRLKQNMPLKYFLGDNQNAIKIQVWCSLITDLLLQVIKRQVKRKWAFSNIVKLIRLHLFNYMNLISFLENPEKTVIRTTAHQYQLALKLSG